MQPEAIAETAAAKCELACETLRRFGALRFRATGWSMAPAIWSGDTLVVERIRPEQLRVGDVALVGREGRICAHRLISTPESSQTSSWITQGDGLRTPDNPSMETQILGRVAKLVRSGKSKAVSADLSAFDRLLMRLVRRSVFAARVFVYVASKLQTRKVQTCQG